jgi:cytochrome c553
MADQVDAFYPAIMNTENGIFAFRARIFFVLLMGFPIATHSESIMVGDIEINPQDFSANLDSEQRIAKCLSCHGHHAGGDIDFGPDARFGTPALRGMGEQYLKDSLKAYQAGTRRHEEMSVISAILDEETISFMARSFSAYIASPMKSVSELAALAEKDALFLQGQTIARQGISQQGVPACIYCHGPLGEGSATGPRLAGQNVMYIQSQFRAFASGSRKTAQSALMQPVVAGLSDDDIKAVAHYYDSVSESPVVARRVTEDD